MLGEVDRVRTDKVISRCLYSEALLTAEQVIALAVELDNPALEAAGWRLVSEVHNQRGDAAAAREALGRARYAAPQPAAETWTM